MPSAPLMSMETMSSAPPMSMETMMTLSQSVHQTPATTALIPPQTRNENTDSCILTRQPNSVKGEGKRETKNGDQTGNCLWNPPTPFNQIFTEMPTELDVESSLYSLGCLQPDEVLESNLSLKGLFTNLSSPLCKLLGN